jgi:hypothetical protein
MEEIDLKRLSKRKQLVEKLAKDVELIKNFDDVKVIDIANNLLAFTDIEKRILYINIGQTWIPYADFLKHVHGLIVHELGHLDRRLKAPSSDKVHVKYINKIGEKDVDTDTLNFLYDMEIHYQYNVRGFVKPSHKQKLREMLNLIRTKVFEENPTDPILSLEYPQTEIQKRIKTIVEDRSLKFVEKYKLIKEEIKKYEGQISSCISKILSGKKLTKEERKIKEAIEKQAKSIVEDVKKQQKKDEIRDKLRGFNFSDDEINELVEKRDVNELVENIKNLEECMRDINTVLEKTSVREKVRNHLKSEGHRLNGYHKFHDFDELVEEPEELLLSKRDIDSIEIPTLIRPQSKGIIILLRDTSGSVSYPPMDRLVRDITISLIKLAKKKGCKIAVMDFHSQPEPFYDRKGDWITTDYNIVLLDAMKFRTGFSTRMRDAIERFNKELKKAGKEKEKVNLFIVSDTHVDNCDSVKIENPNCKVVGISCVNKADISSNFSEFMKRHRAKVFQITQNKEGLVAELVDNL